MKKFCLVCTLLVLVPIAGRCQLWLNGGDTFEYEFSNLTSAGRVSNSPGATLQIGMSGVDGTEGLILEIFENGGDVPLLTFNDIRFIPNPIVLGNAWSDRQGVVRFTVRSGSFSLDIMRAAVVYPNGDTYVEIFDIMDSDGDGVLDHRDQCPHTAPGVMVDVFGCSDAQIATTIVAERGSVRVGFVAQRNTFTFVSWTQTNKYLDVKITARLSTFSGLVDQGTAYLTSRVGPGATEADEVAVASFTFPSTLSGSDVLLFSGLTLGPGTYYLIITGEIYSGPSWSGTLGSGPTTDIGVTHNGGFYVPQAAAYPPASTGLPISERSQIFAVTGTRMRPNLPPVANAGMDQRMDCSGPATSVLLDGRESSDPDRNALIYRWWEGATLLGVGATLNVNLSPGLHDIRLVVMDTSGETAEDSVLVDIQDTIAPHIEASASPAVLRPPNGKLVPVVIEAQVLDLCDANASARIVAVESNESSGSGTDWEITGPLTLNLRARRLGTGTGRTYRVTVEASDASGNTARTTVSIVVPR
jgi:hypothetical protein